MDMGSIGLAIKSINEIMKDEDKSKDDEAKRSLTTDQVIEDEDAEMKLNEALAMSAADAMVDKLKKTASGDLPEEKVSKVKRAEMKVVWHTAWYADYVSIPNPRVCFPTLACQSNGAGRAGRNEPQLKRWPRLSDLWRRTAHSYKFPPPRRPSAMRSAVRQSARLTSALAWAWLFLPLG